MSVRLIWLDIFAVAAGLVMALFLLGTNRFPAFEQPAAAALVLAMVLWISLQDLKDFTIPDAPLIVIALVGAALRLHDTGVDTAYEGLLVALDGTLCGGALLLMRETYFRLRGVDGLGFGDVKLAAAGGVLIGTVAFAWALFVASIAGLVVVIGVSLLRPQRRIERLPFGTFLAPVCWGLWVLAQSTLWMD